MEQVIEKIDDKKTEFKVVKEKKSFKILGISIWRIFAYFVVYSVIGYVIETLFGIARYGMLESRKSFLYGPFCAIYGVGAVIMILSLQYFKKNHNTLFIGGVIVGSIIEYLVSWIGEIILHVKWWDYSGMPLNLNGRICLLYSIFWGFLALYLMVSLNPKIDKFISFVKTLINPRFVKTIMIMAIILMLLDCIFTAVGLSYFRTRVIKENNIEVKDQEEINRKYNKIYNNKTKVWLIDKFLNNEKMLKTFPRITVEDKDGNIYSKRVGTMVQRYTESSNGWVNDATYPILYGDITKHPEYKPYMRIQVEERYALNSQGKSVPIQEVGWAAEGELPTHIVLQFTSSHGGAYIGSPGNTMWIDNVELIY